MAAMNLRRILRRPRTWLIAVPVAALLAITAGPFVYINFIKDDPPARLGFDDLSASDTADSSTTIAGDGATTTEAPDTTTTTTTTGDAATGASGIDGTWSVADGSQVGYRVTEVLFGQDTEGVGRTSDVTGTFVISGTTVREASFEVDMTTFESDVETYPTATFTLSEQIELTAIPDDLVEVSTAATGELTLHGTTKEVTIDLVARRNGSNIEVTGSLTIVFDEWGIPNPSNAAVSTNDEGLLELALVLVR
jgi:polyisoprenoid-binding protein YceI